MTRDPKDGSRYFVLSRWNSSSSAATCPPCAKPNRWILSIFHPIPGSGFVVGDGLAVELDAAVGEMR